MGATFVAPRQALVHAVPVGLVGDDEYPAVRQCRRTAEEGKTGQKRRNGSHGAPMDEGTAPIGNLKVVNND